MKHKIFCIGLNKTGTSSLHEAFQILGLKSVHFKDEKGINIKDVINENYLKNKDILHQLSHYDAISDWDRPPYTFEIIKKFDEHYPNSKFIVNTRDIEDWLNSREKHVKRNQKLKEKQPNLNITWLKIDRDAWRNEYEIHYNAIEAYFKNRKEDVLYFDVTQGDDWEKLCPFLHLPIPLTRFPAENMTLNMKTVLKKTIRKISKLTGLWHALNGHFKGVN